MSLLTRCPSCTTLYRVVPDQLRISQGWVKCGQCGEIFDASQNLIQASTEPEVVPLESSGEVPVTTSADSLGDVQVHPPEASFGGEDQSRGGGVCASDLELGVSSVSESAPAPDRLPDSLAEVASSQPVVEEDNSLLQLDNRVLAAPEVNPDLLNFRPSDEITAEDAELERVSFLHGADRKSAWHKPIVRGILLILAVILGLGLAAQWAFRERDRLAAAKPEWAPALEYMCGFLHCSVRAYEQIESLVIDSAGFKKNGPDSYRLTFSLRNNSSFMLALPSVELTLTDSQDRAVIRKVLSPAELSAPSDRLAAGSEWPVTVAVRVRTEASAPPVLGYRMLVFYP